MFTVKNLLTANNISGDKMNRLWENTQVMPSFPKLDGDVKTRVLIVGGGLAGILTAYMLNRAGADYLLIEADEICRGVTGGTTAKITSQHGLIYRKLFDIHGSEYAYMYWKANQAALDEYRRLCSDISCNFEEKSNVIYTVSNGKVIDDELNVLKRLGIPALYREEMPLPLKVRCGVEFKNQAQFNPFEFVLGIAKGLNIREHTKALEFRGKTVITDCGVIEADKIIIATHFPVINKHGAFFAKMYQNRSYVIALENAGKTDGMYLDENEKGFSFRDYGDLLLLGGGSHRTGESGGAWAELEEFAKKHYPGSAVRYRWAAQDCITLDGSAYIGRYGKTTPDLYTATGFNKWGMTLSMVSAMLLCDEVTGKNNPYSPVFNPSRKLYIPQLAKNIRDSARNIFTFSKPRCPHLGCALKWNSAEHSWDCPCHGSRFSEDGKLLDNPAEKDKIL